MGILNTIRFINKHPLTRDHRLGAYSRFLRWQIGTRVFRFPVVAPFTDDARLIVSQGMTGATGNVYCGLHEFNDMGFLLHALRAEDLFVDVGANVGSYTVLAGKVCGAKVIAAEPIPEAYSRLLDNIAINHIQLNVRPVRAGVGRQSGSLRFTKGEDTMNHALAEGESAMSGEVECPVQSLDNILAGEIPRIIKIDVEGFEAEVLAGAEGTLSKSGVVAVLMEMNGSGQRYGTSDDILHETMSRHGFKPFHYNAFDRLLKPLQSWKESFGNTLYLRNPESVADCVRAARPFRVFGRSI